MLKVGDPAPSIELASDAGKTVRSSDLKGNRYVPYFYPKDNTPTSTTEADTAPPIWQQESNPSAKMRSLAPACTGVASSRPSRSSTDPRMRKGLSAFMSVILEQRTCNPVKGTRIRPADTAADRALELIHK